RKSIFSKIDGFAGIGFIRSGDDDLMLQKMAKFIRKANFMFSPDSIVPSLDKDNISEMVQLESRRASKWRFYPLSVKILSGFVFVYYLVLTAAFGLVLLADFSLKIFVSVTCSSGSFGGSIILENIFCVLDFENFRRIFVTFDFSDKSSKNKAFVGVSGRGNHLCSLLHFFWFERNFREI
ncbi:MAG: hypothetical protein B6D62_03320, partial [Candidatus Cloacimonas sp. 4484_275]